MGWGQVVWIQNLPVRPVNLLASGSQAGAETPAHPVWPGWSLRTREAEPACKAGQKTRDRGGKREARTHGGSHGGLKARQAPTRFLGKARPGTRPLPSALHPGTPLLSLTPAALRGLSTRQHPSHGTALWLHNP